MTQIFTRSSPQSLDGAPSAHCGRHAPEWGKAISRKALPANSRIRESIRNLAPRQVTVDVSIAGSSLVGRTAVHKGPSAALDTWRIDERRAVAPHEVGRSRRSPARGSCIWTLL